MSDAALRFAFDLGTNSIGWAVYELDRAPKSDGAATITTLAGCGVRLFDDGRNPKDGSSLAEMRRVPRSARRRRDRYLERRANLLALLVTLGLMPADAASRYVLAASDPYPLRARGLDAPLTSFEFGRALMHLNQRRGFKSNRRADRKGDGKEKGLIADAAARLRDLLAAEGARTFGELMWKRHGGPNGTATPRTRQPVRIRIAGDGAKALYEIYPTRDMLEAEFSLLIATQRTHMPAILNEAAIRELRQAIFMQRPLKPVPRGRCTLVPDEPRLSKALPSVEERVIYETLNHLRFGHGVARDQALTKEQRDLVAATLVQGKTGKYVSFDTLRTALKLPTDVHFSLEDGGKTGLDDFASKSAKAMGDNKKRFGPRWHALPLDVRDAIVSRLENEDDEDAVVAWLMADHGLDSDAARAVARWTPPEGVARLGKTANSAILAELKADMVRYHDAVRLAGEKLGLAWHHSDFRDGVIELPLPYYGQILERHVSFGSGNPLDITEKRYGRITNPTVHIALGQLRRLVNALVRNFGEPRQIVVELARDLKLTQEQKDKERRENTANRSANDARRRELERLGQDDNGENRLRMRLYEEQQRANGGVALCPYSLKPIGLETLFSPEIEIDHILPYSRTLDDTKANRVLCYRAANRLKRRQTPHEAFGDTARSTPDVSGWADIIAAAAKLPANKRWRFGAEAMERYQRTERDFLARQINETRHLSRLARLYLGAATGTTDQVYVTTGQLTAMLRARWGLNSILGDDNRKQRSDHRHHAVDACVIGAIDRSLLQEMARRAGVAEEEGRTKITSDVPDPFPNFRDTVRDKIRDIVVSVKPEHGKGGALHEDTAYGLVTDPNEAAEIGNLVFRKPLADLTPNEIDRVRDPHLRQLLQDLARPFRDASGKLTDAKALKSALAAFHIVETHDGEAISRRIRRVRIGKAKTGEVHIKDRRSGAVYKALLPGENHHIDIVQMRDGNWRGFAATVFEVNQTGWRPLWERERLGGKLVMRVHKGDMIEVDGDVGRRVMTIHRLSPSNNVLYLAGHHEGGELQKRHDDKDDPFRWDFANIGGLKKRNARKVRVDVAGRVIDCRSNTIPSR